MTQVDAANPLKVGIVGGTGYTGVELLRLLVRHPRCAWKPLLHAVSRV